MYGHQIIMRSLSNATFKEIYPQIKPKVLIFNSCTLFVYCSSLIVAMCVSYPICILFMCDAKGGGRGSRLSITMTLSVGKFSLWKPPKLAYLSHLSISHRSLSFILLPQISTARSTIFRGGSTLRINICISEITVHKDSSKCHFFASHGSIATDLLLGNNQYTDILWKIAP